LNPFFRRNFNMQPKSTAGRSDRSRLERGNIADADAAYSLLDSTFIDDGDDRGPVYIEFTLDNSVLSLPSSTYIINAHILAYLSNK
jgi:hypothetical protein